MHETAARYPELTIQAEGPCSDGRQMWSLNLGDPARPTIYLGAAIHGWEWENAYGLLRFAEVISQDRTVEGLNTRHFHYKILPIQNPWGYDHFTRQNAHGVDLNRNFDCGWQPATGGQDVLVPWDYNYNGTRAASERETQIMQGIIDRFRPVALVDFHTADYVMLRGHRGDRDLFDAIQKDVHAAEGPVPGAAAVWWALPAGEPGSGGRLARTSRIWPLRRRKRSGCLLLAGDVWQSTTCMH